MRIFSNTLLSWPQVLHTFQVARLYPGHWHHYYFYKIQHINPLVLTTHSPIELLQENCQYYCYYKYQRDKHIEQNGNIRVLAITHNQNPSFGEETWIHIPKIAEINDVIVIRNNDISGFPNINFKSAFNFPAPSPSLA
jgi:hypothetical protein